MNYLKFGRSFKCFLVLNFYGKIILKKGHVHFLAAYSFGQPGMYPGNPTDLLSAESCPCVCLLPAFNIPLMTAFTGALMTTFLER